MTPIRRPVAPVGIALAGGGFLGAAYELGALAALSESIDGLDLTALDVYVGVSAGAFVAAGLANGLSPHAMVRMFVESEVDDGPFDPASLLRPAWGELRERLAVAPSVLSDLLDEMRRGLLHGGLGTAVWRGLDRAASLLPTGVIDAAPAELKLAALLGAPGRTNRFDGLRATLRIVATDIDTGETVAFGGPGTPDVPISRAVLASAAVPGLFPPVKIAGRWFVDGALNKTLHASIALQEGARLVLCLNPPRCGARADGAHRDPLADDRRPREVPRHPPGRRRAPVRAAGRRRDDLLHADLQHLEPAGAVRARLPAHARGPARARALARAGARAARTAAERRTARRPGARAGARADAPAAARGSSGCPDEAERPRGRCYPWPPRPTREPPAGR
jgi:predicted acylesterase/phospholipase RssA